MVRFTYGFQKTFARNRRRFRGRLSLPEKQILRLTMSKTEIMAVITTAIITYVALYIYDELKAKEVI